MNKPTWLILTCCFVGCDASIREAVIDGGSTADNGLAAGAPCESDIDCAMALCLPSNNLGANSGYCFERGQAGCTIVTIPSPFATLCDMTSKVFVCGDSWDIGSLGICAVVGTGDIGETYHCCKPNGFH